MSGIAAAYVALAGAIVFEVTGTNFLARSEHVTKLGPTTAAAIFYALSFYLLAQALRQVPLGVAYGLWGGLGVILTAAMSVIVFKQRLDMPAVIGIGFILVGVVIVNGFSKSMTH